MWPMSLLFNFLFSKMFIVLSKLTSVVLGIDGPTEMNTFASTNML